MILLNENTGEITAMARDPRYDVLFEPVRIGPKVAKNRFYQVPHCTGMGSDLPQTVAAMRGIKAAGGWGVVCTEYCSIHASACDYPYPQCRLWDDDDIKDQALMVEAVHEHGALAGVELWHGGVHAQNTFTREGHLAPSARPIHGEHPMQARAMDKQDIRTLRRWHVDAARRAQRAGFDIVYVYAGHGYLPAQFLSRRYNERTDEYGGPIENRARLLRELIEDTHDAVGDSCAVAVRLMVDELHGPDGITSEVEGRETVEMLAELPDLWDVQLGFYIDDARSSRFVKEGAQEPYVAFVKKLTTKPVVGVGRFTSPDTMVSQIRRGILDLIGAARPSIADPFLPKKIEEGRPDDIRECIGCNICIASNGIGVPLRCTQNPTMGEEWRKGWHPEIIPAKASDDAVLIVGAGPAGLEAARALGSRGYSVHLAEATTELGGRVSAEARLPGLAEWIRVRDWRLQQLAKLPNVEIYRDSRLDAAEVRAFGFPRVVVATGARWRRDGVGRSNMKPIDGHDRAGVLTPDEVMAGARPRGPVVVFDDDHYYMGGVIAEALAKLGNPVTLVTTAGIASSWTNATLEQGCIQKRLLEAGIAVVVSHNLKRVEDGMVEIANVYSGKIRRVDAEALVMATARLPVDSLHADLVADPAALADAGIRSVARIGDCLSPGTIAAAVYGGHRAARELDAPTGDLSYADVPFRRERIALG
jgi:dimethylamine/trimethylamine dehydrogenase